MTIRDPSSQQMFPGTWKHRKGGVYEIIGFCIIEATMKPAVIYAEFADRRATFVRPCSEFFDGRFTPEV